jgi:hypothetical protein
LLRTRHRPYEHWICGATGRESHRGTAHRRRLIIFRVVAGLAHLFLVVAVVLMASAPWVLLQADQQARTELNRWFLSVAGSVDAIAAGALLSLALQPRRTQLTVEHAVAAIVAGAINPSLPALVHCDSLNRGWPR